MDQLMPRAPVPPAAPLSMPTQDLGAPAGTRRFRSRWRSTLLARIVTFGGALLLTAFATRQMHQAIVIGTVTTTELVFIALFAFTFVWIALAACVALAGVFGALLARLDARQAPGAAEDNPGSPRPVAIVMPIYNEDPAGTCASLEAMALDLQASGRAGGFEIFLLSDTTRADVWLAETAAVDLLRHSLAGIMPVWYRRRSRNVARKAGNLKEFVEGWGARYDSMLVLDADSLMAADTVLALVDEMAVDPALGILQSVPRLADGEALFARMQQFAGSVYGPVVANGLAAWHGTDGNYWGHNAIIRVEAFAHACGLPVLPGRRPLGGDILSHDFVEAALVRKAGWSVRMLPELGGSWENSPPSLLDVAVRDRRWAQGNIQHLAIIAARGLAWPNRVHLLTGVMSYVASFLWLCLIGIGLALTVQTILVRPEYFGTNASLFPDWPVFDSERMRWLFIFSMSVLLFPKLVGTLRVLTRGALRRAHGGGLRVVASVLLETFLSALYAPIMMLLQTRQLLEIVLGRDSGWNLQNRTSDLMPWSVVVQRHAGHMLAGIALLIPIVMFMPQLLPWMAPVIAGLILAAPLSRWSADARMGKALARAGLLLVPEEHTRPAQFHARDARLPAYESATHDTGLARLLDDPATRRRHFTNTTGPAPQVRGHPDVIRLSTVAKLEDARSSQELFGWLKPEELMVLLGDRALFERIPGVALPAPRVDKRSA